MTPDAHVRLCIVYSVWHAAADSHNLVFRVTTLQHVNARATRAMPSAEPLADTVRLLSLTRFRSATLIGEGAESTTRSVDTRPVANLPNLPVTWTL